MSLFERIFCRRHIAEQQQLKVLLQERRDRVIELEDKVVELTNRAKRYLKGLNSFRPPIDAPEVFKQEDLHCSCGRRHYTQLVSHFLLFKLNQLQEMVDFDLTVTSGYRCPEHNAEIGGAEESSHVSGLAVDIHCDDGRKRRELVFHALLCDFQRIIMYHDKSHVHLDIDKEKGEAIWIY